MEEWTNCLNMLMHLKASGWKFGICRSELIWDECGMRSPKTLQVDTLYCTISTADSALRSNAPNAELRMFSLCLERFTVMTETNSQITTDLPSPAWWIHNMEIVNTCKETPIKHSSFFFKHDFSCNGIIFLL